MVRVLTENVTVCHAHVRVRQNLTLLLTKLREIVSAQTEAEVLETCGRTLETLCDSRCAVYSRCNVARATLTDMCVNRYKEAIDEFRSLVEGVSTFHSHSSISIIVYIRGH